MPKTDKRPLTLYPLKFEQALVALAKTKPEPKPVKPKAQSKGRKKAARRN